MTSLSDTQRVLLSTASQRERGSIMPLPACLKSGGGTTKALEALLSHKFAEELETTEPAEIRRTENDLRYGLFVTPLGLAAIGVGPVTSADAAPCTAANAAPAPARTSKTTAVLDLLRRADGATMPELIEATGWLPHTTRAALTGIRKKGHAVERSKRDGATCYRIAVAG